MLPLLRRLGKGALAIELSAVLGLCAVFHDLNAGGPEARRKWDERAGPCLVDAFHKVTGDDRVVAHRARDDRRETGGAGSSTRDD